MSDYAFVADQAKKVFATVAKLESELVRRPSDRGLSINLTSMRRRAEQAKIELERLAALNHIEICQYRMVPVDDREYGLKFVAKSLLEYQNLFSQIYDAFKNGKKSNAQIGREAELESTLDFAYSTAALWALFCLHKVSAISSTGAWISLLMPSTKS